MLPLPDKRLDELERLRLAEGLQRHLRHREITSQVDQLGGKLRVELQLFTAHRAKPQYPAAMFLPDVSQVAYQVQGGLIRPLQIIHEQHQRSALAQCVEESRHRFK